MSINDFLHQRLIHALRPYQLSGLNCVNNYINSNSDKQALIKSPMGTGKTAMIGVVASYFPEVQTCLIITVSASVKKQVIDDIKINTWENLGVGFYPVKPVIELLPSNSNEISNRNHPTTYVSTIQSLLQMKRENVRDYELLKSKINLVVFDEGHKEPAQQWQSTIRGLETKVVLFTATPVRNDFNKFSIENDFTYIYPLNKAIQEGFIRDVNFSKIDTAGVNTSRTDKVELFTVYMKQALEGYIQQYECDSNDVKIIIRCNSESDIELIVEKMNSLGISTKGVHERFSVSGDTLLKNLPKNLREDSTVCWVHQYKLIEGIDNNKFSLLGIYDALPDHRSLIQQIGRVIRKGKTEVNQKAEIVVWDHQSYQLDWWKGYCSYERSTENNEANIIFNHSDYINAVIDINPAALYTNKQYLERYSIEEELDNISKLKKYQLPKKVNIYVNHSEELDFDAIFNATVDGINSELHNRDKYVLDRIIIQEQTIGCFIYSSYSNSPYLVKENFLEPQIGILFFRLINNMLFFNDTNNFMPQKIKEDWTRISALKLKKLFDKDTSISSATIQNGSMNFNHFNRMILYSNDISRMAQNISDQYNLLTTVQGKRLLPGEKTSLRRYVGFSNARISQASSITRLDVYNEWLTELHQSLEADAEEVAFFNRYAPITDIPEDTSPISILFHVEEDELLRDSDDSQVELDTTFYEIQNNNFNFKYKQHEYLMNINFDPDSGTYSLEFSGISNEPDLYYGSQNFFEWINDSQSIQLLLQQNQYRYFKGNFYKIGIPDNYSGLLDLLDENEIDLPSAVSRIKEKGDYFKNGAPAPTTDMWDENSLFYLVAMKGININNDSKLKVLLEDAEYIICSDLNSEIADFITVNESTNTVCFIHCKAGSSQLSASTFQEVCGQVSKNLDYVNDNSSRRPVDLDKWNGYWKNKSYKAVVNRRVVNQDNLSAHDIWDKLKAIQRNPRSNTLVIALVGDAFSKGKYDRESLKSWGDQKPEKIQIDYLLLETSLAVERAKAKFMVSYTKRS